ncbi:hypothetical protein SISSUDRAFT_1036666 [Sistotremastrum suecicum HHB10207 ss-3]|uniref:Uncharacterized protein n=1 Tax=Sistotremastrum suecicum HHB10207 ss-3 TaxID=1314776 RepID=A0A165Z5N8_9AGAM|nr:hypothetical protein SISSUDRAFT_1036666 [Sistotremastrum suecicum HHB10207 ss-3]
MFGKYLNSIPAFFAVSLLLASNAAAHIESVESKTGQPAKIGTNYTIEFTTGGFSQPWNDYSVILGWSAHPFPDPTSIGTIISGSFDLPSIGESVTLDGTFDHVVFIDPKFFTATSPTPYLLVAAITSITGADNSVSVRFLNTTITVEP